MTTNTRSHRPPQQPVYPVPEKEYRLLTCADVMSRLKIGEGFAYRIIRQLNQELKAGGYIVISGRVPETKFNERFYS